MKTLCWLPVVWAATAWAVEPVSAPLPTGPAASPTIELRAVATVAGEPITLGDVANLPAGSPLAGIELARAPLPGGRRALSRGQVELGLARAGYAPEHLFLTGADTTLVTRASQSVSLADLAAGLTPLVPVPVTIERVPPRLPLPCGQVTYRLRTELPHPLEELFNVGVDVLVNGRLADQFVVGLRQVQPKPVASVLVAVPAAAPAMLPATPAVTPAAVPVALVSAPAAPAAAAPRSTWEVKWGAKLTVTAVSGRVRISLQAEARSTGRLGDVIQCETQINRERRIVAARLVAPDHAVMEF